MLYPEYAKFVDSRVKWLGSLELNLVHAAVGLVGEVNEFRNAKDRPHAMEELGDADFYLTAAELSYAHAKGMDVNDLFDDLSAVSYATPFIELERFDAEAHILLDTAKKLWIYEKKAVIETLPKLFYNCRERQVMMLRSWGFTVGGIRDANVDKLIKRYPTGYTNQAAQARADKAGES